MTLQLELSYRVAKVTGGVMRVIPHGGGIQMLPVQSASGAHMQEDRKKGQDVEGSECNH